MVSGTSQSAFSVDLYLKQAVWVAAKWTCGAMNSRPESAVIAEPW